MSYVEKIHQKNQFKITAIVIELMNIWWSYE